jgi:hypothetical protein
MFTMIIPNKSKVAALTMILMGALFVSCTDDKTGDDTTTSTTTTTGSTNVPSGISFSSAGTLKLDIGHVFEAAAFDLSPTSYITMANDTIRVSQLSYYVSNIELTSVNGNKVPLEGYFLEDFLPGKPNTITLQNVPSGNYTSISYIVGVDSIANSTGTHTGDLDPSFGMYWTWNTGYVFVRLKGRHSAANSLFSFDIGGDQNVMRYSHSLLGYKVKKSEITVSVQFDIAKVFNAPFVYDLKTDVNDIHSTTSTGLAKFVPNIKNAFSLKNVQ